MHSALVTGANGFIGGALVRRLLRDGVRVRALSRDPARPSSIELADAGAAVVRGDCQDERSLARAAPGCDVVFHVAAVVGMGGAAQNYNVNVAGTRNTLRTAHKAGAARFVHVSTIAVYGYDVSGCIDETHPFNPSATDNYQLSKTRGESAAWAYTGRTGFPVAAIRPAFVYGPGSMFWSRTMYDLCRRMPTPMVDGGQGNAHPIYIDDVVDLMVALATHPDAPGKAFHAAPDPALTWAEFIGAYARLAGQTRQLSLPVAPITALSGTVSALARLMGHSLDLAGVLRYWAHRATYSMARARDVLNWQPKTTFAQGIGQTTPWLLAARLG